MEIKHINLSYDQWQQVIALMRSTRHRSKFAHQLDRLVPAGTGNKYRSVAVSGQLAADVAWACELLGYPTA